MSSAERLPADESPQGLGDLISIGFGQNNGVEITDNTETFELRSVWLGQSANEFVEEQMERYGISDDIVVNHALESHKFFTGIVNGGGHIEVVDRFGRRHPVEDNLDKPNPAA